MMADPLVVRAGDGDAVPWKNGRGFTREILTVPLGNADTEFAYRFSVATVDSIGPFSVFPGVERTLCVLEGALILNIDGGPELRVDAASLPLRFDGEARVFARPADNSATVFNLMTDRTRPGVKLKGWTRTASPMGKALFVLARQRTNIVHGAWRACLEPRDAMVSFTGDTEPFLFDQDVICVFFDAPKNRPDE